MAGANKEIEWTAPKKNKYNSADPTATTTLLLIELPSHKRFPILKKVWVQYPLGELICQFFYWYQ